MSVHFGRVCSISAGDYRAEIGALGATLMSLQYCGRDLILPASEQEIRRDMRGTVLAPWPNRLDGGIYEFGGQSYELPLNDPGSGNATHGLVSWVEFQFAELTDSTAILSYVLRPQPGYPWCIRIDVTMVLSRDGLLHTVTATNLGEEPAPYGVAVHPYVVLFSEQNTSLNDWTLQLPAQLVDMVDDRSLPVSTGHVASVENGVFDFREPRVIGSRKMNHAFSEFPREYGNDKQALIRVMGGTGGVELSLGKGFDWVQLYTHDFAETGPNRQGIAIEPMTCPANAFNSGKGLIRLEPGAVHVASWSMRALR